MGLRKPGNDEINEEDKLNVISAVAKDAGIDKNDFNMSIKYMLLVVQKMETRREL